MFRILYFLIWIISWVPLVVLYLLADFLYYVLYYIARYRRGVVRTNLTKSFPEKSIKEIISIEKKFYRYLCDVFIEAISEMHMSKKEMMHRMKFVNVDTIIEQYQKGKSCMLMTAHYGNWEWASTLSVWLPEGKPLYGIYKKLSSKSFDFLMCELRMKFTGKNIEKDDLARKMLELRSKNQLAMFGMISDQTPSITGSDAWVKFLNQDTLAIVGTEVLAKKFDYPVFYAKITRIKRGYYTCEFIPISMTPKTTEKQEITIKYMQLLEETIQNNPPYWLWTHKRWKHKKETLA